MQNKIKFGTGGMPITTINRDVVEGIKRIKELGLDSMELEFVYQTFAKTDEQQEKIRVASEENKVDLTVHGSYYINLASPDKQKWNASINRVIEGAKAGDKCGAKSITFHPAAFMGREKEEVFELVKSAMIIIMQKHAELGLNITIAPELTGKTAQFGDLEDLIRLIEELDNKKVKFCFDFAHKHARDGGGWNSSDEFDQMFKLIKKRLGEEFLKDMHLHMSGINYSPKGERNHLTLLSSDEEYRKNGVNVGDLGEYYEELAKNNRLDTPDIKWKELMEAFKSNNVGGIVVCESPNLEQDALLMKNYYEGLFELN